MVAEKDRYEEFKTSMLYMWFQNFKEITRVSDENKSPIEKIVHLRLLTLYLQFGFINFDITPQAKVLKYIADFLVVYGDKKIVIECDGHEFHEKTKEQASKDKRRDREMQMAGYIVFRYSGADIYKDPNRVATDMLDVLGAPDWAKPEKSTN